MTSWLSRSIGVSSSSVQDADHLVRRDPGREHAADEGTGAGADVHVEVVDPGIDGEQIEGAQRADLVDAAGETASTEHEGGLRGTLASPRAASFRGVLDVYDLPHRFRDYGSEWQSVSNRDAEAATLTVSRGLSPYDDPSEPDPSPSASPVGLVVGLSFAAAVATVAAVPASADRAAPAAAEPRPAGGHPGHAAEGGDQRQPDLPGDAAARSGIRQPQCRPDGQEPRLTGKRRLLAQPEGADARWPRIRRSSPPLPRSAGSGPGHGC